MLWRCYEEWLDELGFDWEAWDWSWRLEDDERNCSPADIEGTIPIPKLARLDAWIIISGWQNKSELHRHRASSKCTATQPRGATEWSIWRTFLLFPFPTSATSKSLWVFSLQTTLQRCLPHWLLPAEYSQPTLTTKESLSKSERSEYQTTSRLHINSDSKQEDSSGFSFQ